MFDDSILWAQINKQSYASLDGNGYTYREKFLSTISNYSSNSEEKVGLFNNHYLKNPEGLKEFSKVSLARATDLVEQMRNDKSKNGLRQYIVNLDKVSDTLCRVIDLCEFIRSAHPDPQFVKAAQQCHEEMFEFMNVLNTDVELYQTLKEVLNNNEILLNLSEEEIKVGTILLEDFENSGICMNSEVREKFISLSQDISLIGQDFINNTNTAREDHVKIKRDDLSDVPRFILDKLKKHISGEHYKIPTFGNLPFAVIGRSSNEKVREKLWTALHSCPDGQIKRITHLIKLRAILANLMGKSSFADYQLDGKMAKHPQGVKNFIQSLIETTRPFAARELKFIADMKCKDLKIDSVSSTIDILQVVRPWDRDYYSWLVKRNSNPKDEISKEETISAYFSLGSVLEGLSDIFQNIYGLQLKPEIPKKGETWSSEVRKINVVSETDGIVGVIYCDLFRRFGKTSHPSHFTVCCSRRTYPKENDESIMQIGVDSNGVRYQLPIISLVCNFSTTRMSSDRDRDICLLQLSEIETLFHEMGHAMHSMLGRTRLQSVSGTRCPTDFVELPSIIMEHFARDIRILRKIGVHHITNIKVPEELLVENLEEGKFLQNCENFAQAKMATLDQALHGTDIIQHINEVNVVDIYQNLEREMKVFVDDKSNWCGRFGHLFGYGATYYSYLLDRAIASKVWEKLFAKDPLSREGGTQFRDKVLKWGGVRDPWECVADVLDESFLVKGDSDAMKYIGNTQDL